MGTLIEAIRYAAGAALTISLVLLIATVRYGRGCAHYEPNPYGPCMYRHEWLAKALFWCSMPTAALVVAYELIRAGLAGTLFWVCLALFLPFMPLAWYAAYRHTGELKPHTHRYFVYTCFWIFSGAYISGMSWLFPKQAEYAFNSAKLLLALFAFMAGILWEGCFG